MTKSSAAPTIDPSKKANTLRSPKKDKDATRVGDKRPASNQTKRLKVDEHDFEIDGELVMEEGEELKITSSAVASFDDRPKGKSRGISELLNRLPDATNLCDNPYIIRNFRDSTPKDGPTAMIQAPPGPAQEDRELETKASSPPRSPKRSASSTHGHNSATQTSKLRRPPSEQTNSHSSVTRRSKQQRKQESNAKSMFKEISDNDEGVQLDLGAKKMSLFEIGTNVLDSRGVDLEVLDQVAQPRQSARKSTSPDISPIDLINVRVRNFNNEMDNDSLDAIEQNLDPEPLSHIEAGHPSPKQLGFVKDIENDMIKLKEYIRPPPPSKIERSSRQRPLAIFKE